MDMGVSIETVYLERVGQKVTDGTIPSRVVVKRSWLGLGLGLGLDVL